MANVIKLKRGSGSDPGASDLVVGEIALRTDTGKIFTKKDDGSVAEISGSGGGGNNFKINTISQSNGTGGGSATFNGSAYRFTLSDPPGTSAAQCLVSVNGVIQKPVAGTSQPAEGFAISGNDILFSSAPASGADYFIVTYDALSVTEVSDNSVDEGDLKISNAGSNGQFLQKQSGNTGGLTWASVSSYTHPNHSGEVTSSGDGATTIASNVVDEDNLKVSNSPTNGYFLSAQSGNTGGLTWAAVDLTALSASNLTSGTVAAARLDTATTQSAGNNSTKIATTAFVSTAVTNLIGGAPGALDTLNELAAAINDDSSYASTVTTALGTKMPLAGGTFTGSVVWDNASNAGKDWKWNPSQNQVELADDVKLVCGDSDDLEIYHSSSNAAGYIQNSTGNLFIEAPAGSAVKLRKKGTTEVLLQAIPGGAIELYHNNTKRFQTYWAGVEIVGRLYCGTDHFYLGDNIKAMIGDGDDFQIFHQSSDQSAVIKNANDTGWLRILSGDSNSSGILLKNRDDDVTYLKAYNEGAVELYYANNKKIETTSAGATVTGTLTTSGTGGGAAALGSHLDLGDSQKVRLGASDDLQLFHNGTNYVDASNGHFYIRNNVASDAGGDIFIEAKSGETSIKCQHDGYVELYYDGSKKLETTSGGITVTGKIFADSLDMGDNERVLLGADDDLQCYHHGGHSYITNSTGNLYINSAEINFSNVANNEFLARFIADGACMLYHDSSKKLETRSTGIHIEANSDIRFANGNWTGDTYGKIQQHDNALYVVGGSQGIRFRGTTNADHWYVKSDGDFWPAANNSYDIGSSSNRVRNLYINDLQLSNEGSSNSVDGTWGDWTLQEGEEDIFMINNRSGKKYKMALQEVS